MKQVKLRTSRVFSEELRRQIVREYESGQFTVRELAKLHLVGYQTVYSWIYRYSTYNEENRKVVESNESSEKKVKDLLAHIQKLEAALGRSKLENEYNSKLIELAKTELGIDLKKNFDASPSSGSNPVKGQKSTK
jgi:transposase-like protein